ncbi:hypothetical protein [Acidithiobacillus thiooxidans]|nr:hypothetical protein [Acidithiobacillus thiooxidans]
MKILVYLVKVSFLERSLRQAYRKLTFSDYKISGYGPKIAYILMLIASKLGVVTSLRELYLSGKVSKPNDTTPSKLYDAHVLHLSMNRVYDLPDVEVSLQRKKTVNVLVPAFDFASISAGFFGVFQVARYFKTCGHNVRLVLFDNFYFNLAEFEKKFQSYPGMENLFTELEIEYIGDRKSPLQISSDDVCIATVWYSAYFARKITEYTTPKKFVYLIQDYESAFFPGGSFFSLAEATYSFDYFALFSSESLMNYFLNNDIGGIRKRELYYIFFNNACSAKLLSKEEFFKINKTKNKRKLVFYSRPIVNRNMFELTALAIAEAFNRGILDPDKWDCIGMGLGDAKVQMESGITSTVLPRMNLKEYIDKVAEFDICVTLMASPHPSMIPMDLAGSGAIVVTNTFHTKTSSYFSSISRNIISSPPTLPDLLDAIAKAAIRCEDIASRYENAQGMNYPRNWSEVFGPSHRDFVSLALKN